MKIIYILLFSITSLAAQTQPPVSNIRIGKFATSTILGLGQIRKFINKVPGVYYLNTQPLLTYDEYATAEENANTNDETQIEEENANTNDETQIEEETASTNDETQIEEENANTNEETQIEEETASTNGPIKEDLPTNNDIEKAPTNTNYSDKELVQNQIITLAVVAAELKTLNQQIHDLKILLNKQDQVITKLQNFIDSHLTSTAMIENSTQKNTPTSFAGNYILKIIYLAIIAILIALLIYYFISIC